MNCPHHIAWILPVRNGLHQCFQCWEVVTRKDIIPKFEDLPVELQRRWEAHEKEGQAAAAAAPGAAAKADAKPPAPPGADAKPDAKP